MDTESGTEGQGAAADHQAHEQRLAAALRDLLHQVDVGDYRDRLGKPLGDNLAFQRAQVLVDEFAITHEQLCRTLDECDVHGDLYAGARKIFGLSQASPSDSPPEYDTWRTGP